MRPETGFSKRRLTGAIAIGLTAMLVVPAAATPPGSNGLVVWQREQLNGPPKLKVANADGSGARSVFAGRDSAEFEGTFSPASPDLLFFSRGRRAAYSEDIYAGNLATGQVKRVTRARSADIAPTVSADGTRIAYFAAPRPAILREGRPGPPEQIRVAHLDGTGDRRITPQSKASVDPDWSPDGTRIAYAESRFPSPTTSQTRIMVINVDGTGRRALSSYGGPDEVNPKWTPDGQTIIFESWKRTGTKSDIVAVAPTGGPVRTILATKFWDTNPIPSPDGTRLLFTSDRDRPGRERLGPGFELYTMALDGSDIVRLTNNRSPDIFPDWQRRP
jgi:Tol biopolymer transport system component